MQAVEVQKGEEQVKLLDSIKHCFVSLDPPAVAQQEGGSGFGAGPEVFAPATEENVTAENIVSVGTYLDLEDPKDDLLVAEKGDATRKQSDKAKRMKFLASGTGGKSLASLRRTIPEGSLALGPSLQADIHAQITVSHVADAPMYTAADTVTSSRGKTHAACHTPRRGLDGIRVRGRDKETDISLLDSRATYLKSALDDSQAACDEARNLISSLSSERDGLASEVSTLHSAFHYFKEKMEAQQEAQAQVLYNRVAELEAHVMDVSGRLEGEFYPAYLTALAGRRWLLTHGIELAMVKCLKSPEYQGILVHALSRAVDYGMQEGLAAGHEHGVAGTPLSAIMAYNPETAEAHYLDAVRALEEADFPLVQLLKSKKDSRINEVLDWLSPWDTGWFTYETTPEAAHLQPCLEQLSVPIYHADVKTVIGETSLSFALLNNLIGEASTSAATFFVEDLDTDEDLERCFDVPSLETLFDGFCP
ncbi:hypothetical protein Tco_0660745 [Tanacetum coccineum]